MKDSVSNVKQFVFDLQRFDFVTNWQANSIYGGSATLFGSSGGNKKPFIGSAIAGWSSGTAGSVWGSDVITLGSAASLYVATSENASYNYEHFSSVRVSISGSENLFVGGAGADYVTIGTAAAAVGKGTSVYAGVLVLVEILFLFKKELNSSRSMLAMHKIPFLLLVDLVE